MKTIKQLSISRAGANDSGLAAEGRHHFGNHGKLMRAMKAALAAAFACSPMDALEQPLPLLVPGSQKGTVVMPFHSDSVLLLTLAFYSEYRNQMPHVHSALSSAEAFGMKYPNLTRV